MLRSAGKLFGSAAGSTGAGPAIASKCRTQQPRSFAPALLQEEIHKRAENGQKFVDPAECGEAWLVPEIKHALDEDQVIFGDEEIGETMQHVFGYPAGNRQEAPSNGVLITELNPEGEVEDMGDTAALHMQRAERQMTAPCIVNEDFNSILTKLLNNKEVQHACVNALRGDQKFQAIMDLPNNTPIHVPVQSLMPQGHTNDIEENANGHNLFLAIIQDLASGIKELGGGIAQTAVGAKNLVGKFFIEMGCKLHEILGQPFSKPPADKAEAQAQGEIWPGALTGALMKVACTVFMIVILKRANYIRFV